MLGLIVESILLGFALAMDAFSVSLTNGLNEPGMKKKRMALIAGVFGVFQTAMPLLGWICVHTIATWFTSFCKFIPWIALLLLGYIGGKMIYEGVKGSSSDDSEASLTSFKALIVQGIATSIDALSTGFTISDYGFLKALSESLIIGLVTFIICITGLALGKKIGTKLSGKASILGGVILVVIGIKIFIESIF